jgi:hypothetical protein
LPILLQVKGAVPAAPGDHKAGCLPALDRVTTVLP